MGEISRDIFKTRNVAVVGMQYDDWKVEFGRHFQQKENIVATRHRCSAACRSGGQLYREQRGHEDGVIWKMQW